MQKLLLIRHAKAAAFGVEPGDHGRPLSARGKADARALGALLVQENWVPDLAVISSARRTQDTWEEMAFSSCSAIMEEKLYLASPNTLAREVAHHARDGQTLALVGHNPGTALFAHMLLDQGFDHDGPAARMVSEQFKTGWAAAFEMRAQGPRLAALFDPRSL